MDSWKRRCTVRDGLALPLVSCHALLLMLHFECSLRVNYTALIFLCILSCFHICFSSFLLSSFFFFGIFRRTQKKKKTQRCVLSFLVPSVALFWISFVDLNVCLLLLVLDFISGPEKKNIQKERMKKSPNPYLLLCNGMVLLDCKWLVGVTKLSIMS